MNFNQLRSFMIVAETGNVTRAAEVLNVVQPGELLEEAVGGQLFERARHGMTLTCAEKSLLFTPAARCVRAEIGGWNGDMAGLVTFGLLPSTSDLIHGVQGGGAVERDEGDVLADTLEENRILQ